MTESADAVAVGAGHNGLVAANLLADAGRQILVLEAADRPGGAVRTEEIAAPEFHSELCSAFFPMSAASPVFAELDLERRGLKRRSARRPAGETGQVPAAAEPTVNCRGMS